MAKVFIVALPDFEYLLLDIIGWRLVHLAGVLVSFAPMLELMVAAAVEGLLALTALKQSLLPTNFAGWDLRACDSSLSHCN
jgi:hypothetical protein